ncbi:MAG: N-6 DNA methylase [Spirochaetia bacterium]|nr:N-6 DNA methylase [Spirochaetia bacterium]
MAIPKDLSRLLENFQEHISDYKKNTYNEARLRKEYLDPFFEVLGWDMANKQGHAEAYKEVIHEDAIKVGGSMKAPDYSFRIGGVRKFFLEAKKPSVHIKEEISSAYQIRRYAWSAGLPLSILSDFEELAVYDTSIRPKPDDKASNARVFYCKFDEYEKHWDYLSNTFSKEAILKGSFDKYARDAKAKKGTSTVDREFLKEIEKWRLELAKNIALRNNLSTRELNYAVQLTIDRVLFLRICEDRGIEDYEQLRNLCAQKDIYKNLFSIFDKADQKYNSGLFHFKQEKEINTPPDTVTPGITIDDKILKEILSRLYYPDSPYEFSVISADILGNVYEQFLGKVIVPKGKSAVVEEKPEVRKAGGVYYTPKYIVDYIVENTLGEALKNKTPRMVAGEAKEHSPLRLVDPACGSGSFLIAAYDFLLKWHRDWYANHTPQKFKKAVFKGAGDQWYLTTSEKKKILTNNIFGVDIDPQAVEVTKLNLLLKVLEDESKETIHSQMQMFHERVLPDLGDNIKCGNSLIGSDFYESPRRLDTPLRGTRRPAEGVQQNLFETMSEDEKEKINVFDWEEEWPEIFGRLDTSLRDTRRPSDSSKNAKNDDRGGFDVVIGNPPYGNIFENENIFNYVNRVFACAEYKIDSYTVFIEKAYQLSNKYAFIGLIIPYTFVSGIYFSKTRALLNEIDIKKIIILGKKVFSDAEVDTVILILSKENKTNSTNKCIKIADYRELVSIDFLKNIKYISTEKNAVFLNYGKYLILNSTEKINVFSKIIKNHPNLENYGEFYHGLQSRGDKKAISIIKLKDKNCMPLIKGSDFNRYTFNSKKKYFIYENNNIKSGGNLFYHHQHAKIIIRTTADSIIATIDYEKNICLNSINILIIKKEFNIKLEYLLGILNSSLINYWYMMTVQEVGKTFAEVKIIYLKNIPIRVIDFDNPDDKAMHDQMVQLVDRMLTLNKRLPEIPTPHEKTRVQREIDATDREIDGLVYRLYDLTDEEVRIVEG